MHKLETRIVNTRTKHYFIYVYTTFLLQALMSVGFPNGVWLMPNGKVVQPNQQKTLDDGVRTYQELK